MLQLDIPISTARILYASYYVFHPATSQQSLVRAATWRHKVTQEPRQPERRSRGKKGGRRGRRGSFPGNLLVHDEARVLQPRRAVTDGKARYKNWVRARIRPAGMRFTYVPLIHVIFTSFPPRRTFTPRLSPSAIATLRCSVCIRTFRFPEILFYKTYIALSTLFVRSRV